MSFDHYQSGCLDAEDGEFHQNNANLAPGDWRQQKAVNNNNSAGLSFLDFEIPTRLTERWVGTNVTVLFRTVLTYSTSTTISRPDLSGGVPPDRKIVEGISEINGLQTLFRRIGRNDVTG